MAGGAVTGLLSGVPTALGTFIFTVQVTDSTNATATVQFSLTINGVAPSILAAGINAASYVGGSVSPGEIVVIFGSGLGPDTLVGPQLDTRGYVSSSLAGTQVLFDGVAAPIIYTQASQVSVVVPYEVIGRTQVQVVLSRPGFESGFDSGRSSDARHFHGRRLGTWTGLHIEPGWDGELGKQSRSGGVVRIRVCHRGRANQSCRY